MSASNGSVVLTDEPRVVALKREFRDLDAREEELKLQRAGAPCNAAAEQVLAAVRARKAEIAAQIFGKANP